MKREINIAVIGTGAMGRTHSYSAANLPFFYENLPFRARLHTICSRSAEKGKMFCDDFGFAKHESDIDKIIADDEVDVIDICTPNAAHFDTLVKAVQGGKHIYCEKPMAINTEQTSKVLDMLAHSEKKTVCAMVFHNRFMPAVLRARELVEEGRIGNVVSFSCRYLHNSDMDKNKPAGWKQNSDICGGGTLFDLGSHAIDLVRFLCGEIAEISGRSQIYFPVRTGMDGREWRTNADEAFYMTAKLPGGGIGTIEANKLALGVNDELTIEVYGERGALKFSLMQPNYLMFYDGGRRDGAYGGDRGFTAIECVQRYPAPAGIFPGVKAPVGWLRAHMHSMYTFLSGVHKGELPPLAPSLCDGGRVQAIMQAACESDAAAGVWVGTL